MPEPIPDQLQSSDFLPYLNQHFTIRLEGLEPVVLELIEVTELDNPPRPEGRRPFLLLFLGPPSDRYFVQHTYRLEHEGFQDLDVFIVPIGPQDGRMRYEAIFT